MRSEKKIFRTIRQIKKHYWGNIGFLVLLFLLIQLGALPFFGEANRVSVALERYDIVILIIAIPFSLKFFSDKIKRLAHPMKIERAIGIYKRASFLRLYTLSIITLVQIILYGYSQNMNFFRLTIVLFTVFLFCKPSDAELANMIELPDKGEAREGSGEELDPETADLEKVNPKEIQDSTGEEQFGETTEATAKKDEQTTGK